MFDYQLVKLIHILSATILFGTGIGSAFYMFVANRSKDIQAISFATKYVVIADWIFTSPAIIIQLITGLLLMKMGGHSYADKWVIYALVLFCLTGAFWLPVVYIQIKMRDLAKIAFETKSPLPKAYFRYEKHWIILGCLAFPTVIIIVGLMVFKPY